MVQPCETSIFHGECHGILRPTPVGPTDLPQGLFEVGHASFRGIFWRLKRHFLLVFPPFLWTYMFVVQFKCGIEESRFYKILGTKSIDLGQNLVPNRSISYGPDPWPGSLSTGTTNREPKAEANTDPVILEKY